MIEFTVRLFARGKPPDAELAAPGAPSGPLTSTSFTEWLGHAVEVTGLDPAYRHVLVGVDNRADGWVSTLTVQTTAEGERGVDLSADLSVIVGTPKAQVRAHDEAGTHLTTAWLDAPLSPGQPVTVAGAKFVVGDVTYPYRDESHPEQSEDYQHVVLRPVAELPDVTSLGAVGAPAAMLGVVP